MTTDIPMAVTGLGTGDHLRSSDDQAIPLARERIVVNKIESEHVTARLSIRTHSDAASVDEDLHSEHIDIERVPLGHIVPEPPQSRLEDGVTVIPVVEEVLVVQYRVIEEVRLIPRIETVRHTETVSLRRQEVSVADVSSSGDDPVKP